MTKRVYIAVGHGRTPQGRQDPGAIHPPTGVSEQDAGDPIVAELARLLEDAGVDVRHEAHQDDPNYVGSVDAANRWHRQGRVDAFVAIHHDSHNASPGTGAYWYPGSTDGEDLADAIVNELRGAGWAIRPYLYRARNLYVTRKTAMPAVLVEVGPIGHETVDERHEQLLYAAAAARGVLWNLGIRAPATRPPTPPQEISAPAPSPRLVVSGREIPDVPAANPHAFGIAAAIEANLMEGYADGRWGPNDPVTRAQLATILEELGHTG